MKTIETLSPKQLSNVTGGIGKLLSNQLQKLPDVGLWQEATGLVKLPHPELLHGNF